MDLKEGTMNLQNLLATLVVTVLFSTLALVKARSLWS